MNMDYLANASKQMRTIERSDISELNKLVLDERGKFKIPSYVDLKQFTQSQISQFCIENGMYNFPTKELVEYLKEEIGDEKKVLEIGAGNGVMAKELGILATDSYQQVRADMRELYLTIGQEVVRYGEHVEKYDAQQSISKFKPNVVIAAWVTHKYDPKRHYSGGNSEGVNEGYILERVNKYIFIGNEETHKKKFILEKGHRTFKAEWLYSRSMNKEKNIIWTWRK